MPKITAGSNATVALAAGQVISVSSGGGLLRFEYPSGTVLFEGDGVDQTFGPYATSGNARVTSLIGDIDYSVSTPPGQQAQYVPSSVAITGGTIGARVALDGAVSVMNAPYNAVGDGATDDTAAIQACIDANKGKRILLPSGFTFLGAGILLSGSSYNGTRLIVEGEFKLKPAPSAVANNFISCWAGIAFQDCDRCGIEGRFDGNRAAQQDREHTHIVVLAGVTNFSVPRAFVREIRGDGFYVSQKIIGSSSTNSDGLVIGTLHGENTADDGRNLLSIISCDNVSIGTFHSMKIGGTVGGALMPGGLDIEPDQNFESCKNIVIGSVNVTTAGTNGLSVQGRLGTTATQNVTIGSAVVVNTCAPSVNDGASALTCTNNHTLLVSNASEVRIGSFSGKFTNAYGDAVIVTNSDAVRIESGRVSHVRTGVRVGGDSSDTSGVGVTGAYINLDVDTVVRYGWQAGRITDTVMRGRVTNPQTGFFAGSLFAVIALSTGGNTQTRCTYSISVPYSANWTRAYRNDATFPALFSSTAIRDVDFSPGASWASYNIMKDMAVPITNAIGYTDAPLGVPTTGPHIAGQYMKNGAPAVGSPKGWYCTVSGTPGTWVSEGNL